MPLSRGAPLVILSGGDNNIGQTWKEMLGADGYLLKLIDQQKLSTVLQQLHTKKL